MKLNGIIVSVVFCWEKRVGWIVPEKSWNNRWWGVWEEDRWMILKVIWIICSVLSLFGINISRNAFALFCYSDQQIVPATLKVKVKGTVVCRCVLTAWLNNSIIDWLADLLTHWHWWSVTETLQINSRGTHNLLGGTHNLPQETVTAPVSPRKCLQDGHSVPPRWLSVCLQDSCLCASKMATVCLQDGCLCASKKAVCVPPRWPVCLQDGHNVPPGWLSVPPRWMSVCFQMVVSVPPRWLSVPPRWLSVPAIWLCVHPRWLSVCLQDGCLLASEMVVSVPPKWLSVYLQDRCLSLQDGCQGASKMAVKVPPRWLSVPPRWLSRCHKDGCQSVSKKAISVSVLFSSKKAVSVYPKKRPPKKLSVFPLRFPLNILFWHSPPEQTRVEHHGSDAECLNVFWCRTTVWWEWLVR